MSEPGSGRVQVLWHGRWFLGVTVVIHMSRVVREWVAGVGSLHVAVGEIDYCTALRLSSHVFCLLVTGSSGQREASSNWLA